MSARLYLVPPAPLTVDEARLAIRRLRFEREHGDRAQVCRIGPGVWQVHIWFAKGSVTITRADLGAALDEADTFFEPDTG